MQGGQQVLRSELKNMEDIQRVREAILKGGTVFTDTHTDLIRRHAATLGENGKLPWERYS
jgi:hypothetical protein